MKQKKFNMSLFKGKVLLMIHRKNRILLSNKFSMNSKKKKKRILLYKIQSP